MKKAVNNRLSLSKCKQLLKGDAINYSDEEIIQIRDFLYFLAEIEYTVFIYTEEKEALKKLKESQKDSE